jgi:hypothetical protein
MSWQVMVDPSRVGSVRRKVLAAAAVVLLLSSGTAHATAQLPQSHLYTPTNNGQVEAGEAVLISGGGYDQNGNPDLLVDYQVSTDGGATWDSGYRTAIVRLGGETGVIQALWAYEFTPEEPGVYTIVSRVNTDTVYGQVSAPRTLYVGVPAPAPGGCFWCAFRTERPYEDVYEGRQLELGLRFRVDRPGSVTEISVSSKPGRVSRVRLWRGDGTLLADHRIAGAYPDPFPTAVPVVPGVEYVASYTAYLSEYQATENVFPATVIYAPFVLPAHAGVYSYDNGFPTQTWSDSHYWVTPVFQP